MIINNTLQDFVNSTFKNAPTSTAHGCMDKPQLRVNW